MFGCLHCPIATAAANIKHSSGWLHKLVHGEAFEVAVEKHMIPYITRNLDLKTEQDKRMDGTYKSAICLE